MENCHQHEGGVVEECVLLGGYSMLGYLYCLRALGVYELWCELPGS